MSVETTVPSTGMPMTTASTVPLSPLSFLERSGDVFPDKLAVITAAGRRQTYGELRDHARRVAARLRATGTGDGARVAVLARNGPEALAMHFAVPGAGAVLVALNIRLSPQEYRYILDDCAATVLFVEPALYERVQPVAHELSCDVVLLPDADDGSRAPELGMPLDAWLNGEGAGVPLQQPRDENAPITINYTSGTTGRPKGAVYTHRGAYLNALGVALELQLGAGSTYLWTLPMFHCNGWCFTWGVTALGASHVTLADFNAVTALELIGEHRVSHLCGAPVVLTALAQKGRAGGTTFNHDVRMATGGAPPSPTTIAAMRQLGIQVVHLYGLTETYGPSMVCELQPGWAELDAAELADRLSRQGVRSLNVEAVRVVTEDLRDVPSDGATMGEIIVRSNTVIPGYHGDETRTADAFRDGWLLTGDLAVVHPDGYVEVRDRRKDIIISGGENVSSIEVENVLLSHPDVAEAAVVSAPHAHWGEVPVAFVALEPGRAAEEGQLIKHVRERLAHFKAPKKVIVGALPKTSTGKVQKYELRERVRSVLSD
jgi:fatty-acyl-CoA synthase